MLKIIKYSDQLIWGLVRPLWKIVCLILVETIGPYLSPETYVKLGIGSCGIYPWEYEVKEETKEEMKD